MTELPNGYSIRELGPEEFLPLWRAHRDRIFDGVMFRFPPEDPEKRSKLAAHVAERRRVAFGVFAGDEFVGWTLGHQIDAERFEMYNSAVLEAHRGKGLYRALVAKAVERAFDDGFSVVFSRHHPTNVAVLIPKLKNGFVITGLSLDPAYGTVVELSRFSTSLRADALHYRVGASPLSSTLRAALRGPKSGTGKSG